MAIFNAAGDGSHPELWKAVSTFSLNMFLRDLYTISPHKVGVQVAVPCQMLLNSIYLGWKVLIFSNSKWKSFPSGVPQIPINVSTLYWLIGLKSEAELWTQRAQGSTN